MRTDSVSLTNRTARAAYWVFPSLFLLALYWYGLNSWFQLDDFVWLGLLRDVHGWGDLARAMFSPAQHGTFRPFSERGFFLLFQSIFRTVALPFRIWVFLNQILNLALISSITLRTFRSRLAGFLAPVFWAANSSLYVVVTWSSAYMQALCGFCLLLAFHFLLRYIDTGDPPLLPCPMGRRGLERRQIVVYRVGRERLKNVTLAYQAVAESERTVEPLRRVDVADPLVADRLGPGWYSVEHGHLWTQKRAGLRIGGPRNSADRLFITGICPEDQTRQGPLALTVTIEGKPLPSVEIFTGDQAFHFDFAMPSKAIGKSEIAVS